MKIIIILITLITMAFGSFMTWLVCVGVLSWWNAMLAVIVILVAVFYGGPNILAMLESDDDGR